MTYRIDLAPETEDHFAYLTARQRKVVLDAIEEQLSHEPTKETRNRKLMRPNPLATWELRIGDLRVYYNVAAEPEPLVEVLAVGVKKHEQVWIGNQRVDL